MTPDPAWFYSTLAQSSAAIVGLIGAILGARIAQHVAYLRERQQTLIGLVRSTQRVIKQRSSDLASFEKFLVEQVLLNAEIVAAGKTERSISGEVMWGGSRSGTPWTIDVREQAAQLDRDLPSVRSVRPIYQQIDLSGIVELSALRDTVQRLRAAAAVSPQQPHDMLENDASSIEKLADEAAAYSAGVVPWAFPGALVIIAFLAVVGMIAPLIYLPGYPASSSRNWLLLGFTVGIAALLGYLAFGLTELFKLRTITWLSDRDV